MGCTPEPAAPRGGPERLPAAGPVPDERAGPAGGSAEPPLTAPVPAGPPEGPPAAAAAPISFAEALRHFQGAELPGERGPAAAPRGRGLARLLRALLRPARLSAPLRAERDLALALARCGLDDGERVHVRVLQTIHGGLTRSAPACPRYGAHWQLLGFQGADPGTDLRGAGMLGLLQLLHFVTDARTLPLALGIFQLSQHETQSFPFCLVSLNITSMVVRALRAGRLSRECRRRRQVLAVLNDVYAGAFLRLGRGWAARRATLADAGALLHELETIMVTRPRQLLKSLESFLSRGPAAPAHDRDFTGVWELPAEPDGDAPEPGGTRRE